jgi:serine-type D-Ala-D-Ala carboxypeptidase/endopeptidase
MTRAQMLLAGLLIGSLFRPGPAAAQAPPPVNALPSDAEIQKLIATRVDTERRNLGIVVGIVTPGGRRIVSHGRSSLNDPRALDGDSVFEIGSVTKIFTSVLLADMVRRGEVKLTDSVFSYLPTPRSRAAETPTITLADLATHTSGLPLWPSGIPATREGAVSMASYTRAQLLEYLSTFTIPADVGRKWMYSNVDAGVLGLALGRRANTSYEMLLETRVTGPLSMRSTRVDPDRLRSRVVIGHDAELRVAPAWNVPTLAGAGSLHSSVNDLLTFLDALGREDGRLAGILPLMLATRRPGPGIPQALGWWIIAPSPQDDGIIVHDGGTLGFSSGVAYDPKSRTGVVVLSNTASAVGDIARHLLRPAIPLTAPAGAAPAKTEIPMDPATFDQLVGRYEAAAGIGFEVSREGDALMIQLPGIPRLRLRPESARTFYVPDNTRLTVTFDLDAEGRATGLTLNAPAGTTPAKRVGGR